MSDRYILQGLSHFSAVRHSGPIQDFIHLLTAKQFVHYQSYPNTLVQQIGNYNLGICHEGGVCFLLVGTELFNII